MNDTIERREMTLSFFGTVDAGNIKTLVSKRINTPFSINNIIASFALNTNRTLKLSFWISPDDDAPTSGNPTGVSILAERGQVDFLVGDDEQKDFTTELIQNTAGWYIKVRAENTDAFPHTIDSQVTLKLNPVIEKPKE